MWKWQRWIDPRVSEAFHKVDRAQFVPQALQSYAGVDEPLPIGEGQTISQPFIVAWMVQALTLHPGDKVLEIGTGSGFEAAILCELTAQADQRKGETVFSIERIAELAERSALLLHRLDYWPHLCVGDGAAGWPEHAPYNAIISSAAPSKVPQSWWQQLAEDGRIIVPIGEVQGEQSLWLIKKQAGAPIIRNLGLVQFVPLISPLLDDPNSGLCLL